MRHGFIFWFCILYSISLVYVPVFSPKPCCVVTMAVQYMLTSDIMALSLLFNIFGLPYEFEGCALVLRRMSLEFRGGLH
jgi:hypothetical protein